MAEPGEFARRALENGKLDLTGAEGLADLVDAETAAQRRQALRQAGGALFRLYEGWRQRLIGAMAQLEAAIDFSDEPDVAAGTCQEGARRGGGAGQRDRARISTTAIAASCCARAFMSCWRGRPTPASRAC